MRSSFLLGGMRQSPVRAAATPGASRASRPLFGVAGAVPASPHRHVPALRLALGPVGFDAHPGRGQRRLPTRDRIVRGSGCEASRDRGAVGRDRLAVPDRRGDGSGHHRPEGDSPPTGGVRGGCAARPPQSARSQPPPVPSIAAFVLSGGPTQVPSRPAECTLPPERVIARAVEAGTR